MINVREKIETPVFRWVPGYEVHEETTINTNHVPSLELSHASIGFCKKIIDCFYLQMVVLHYFSTSGDRMGRCNFIALESIFPTFTS